MLVNLIIILLLIGGFLTGFRQGLVNKLIGLSSFLLALAASVLFYKSVASWLRTWLPYPEFIGANYEGIYYTVLGFLGAYILANLIILLLGKVIQFFASLPIIRIVNKGLGGVFGVLTTYAVILILLLGISYFSIESAEEAVNQSSVALGMIEKTPFISSFY